MNLNLSPEEEAFRREVADWLKQNLPEEWKTSRLRSEDEDVEVRRDWQKKLGEGGWLGLSWPKEYGGRGVSLMEQATYLQESVKARAPEPLDRMGLDIIGPTIIEFGTEEQKRRFLGRILTAEDCWCQGFSEPDAGSDLAALKTQAVADGHDFVVNGQKIWSSFAQYSNWCGLLARTDSEAPKHRGISFLLIDMSSPGISIRPIRQINGNSEFNEVFFDNVRVPGANLLGPLNEGWRVAMRLLTYERGLYTMGIQAKLQSRWEDLRDYTRHATSRNGTLLVEDPRVRDALAEAYTNIQLLRLTNLRYITQYQRGRLPAEETSLVKLHWALAEQGLYDLAMALAGPEGLSLPELSGRSETAAWPSEYLYSRSVTIYGGTQDIHRNIIAERILGLPRG